MPPQNLRDPQPRGARVAFALVVALSFAHAAPVRAQTPSPAQQVEALYAEGVALFRDGKYRQAVERFERAYAIYPEPNLLYNAGKAYEALGELDAALAKYEACIASPEVAPDVRGKAQARTATLEKAQMKSRLAPDESASAAERDATAVGAVTPPPRSGPSTALTVTRWSLGAVAAGLAAGGTVFFIMGASDHGAVSDAVSAAQAGNKAPLTQLEAATLVDDGESKKTVGVVLLGAAGAAAIGTVLAIIMGDDDAPAVAVAPTGRSIAVGGQF